tara:strand:+ start:5126 stop:5812 length:687 start_codon:yes stop_codon:yes gene_type:complete
MYWCLFSIWPVLYIILNNINKPDEDIVKNLENFKHCYSITRSNNIKVNRNIISATHSIFCTLGCLIAYITESLIVLDFTAIYSISYFVWDSYYIVVGGSREDTPYLFHHAVAVYTLKLIIDGYIRDYLLLFMIIGEMSNIPYYIVYHKIKTLYKDKNNIKIWRHIQIVWFILLRYIVFGYYAFTIHYIVINNYLLLGLFYMMYILGIYWGIGQLKGIYRDYYNIIKND